MLSGILSNGSWKAGISAETMGHHLTFANAVGALTAQSMGVIPALPTREMVDEFLSRN